MMQLKKRGGGGGTGSSPDKNNNNINNNGKAKNDDDNDDDSLRDSKGKLRNGNLGGGLISFFLVAIVICWFVLDRLDNVDQQQTQGQQKQVQQKQKQKNQPSLGGDPPLRKNTADGGNGNNNDNDDDDVQYHMVFSTSCSPFQDWQSYMFFHSANKVGQKGTVTRIASGCNDEQQANLEKIHKEQIAILSNQFFIHFTPEFSGSGEHGSTYQQTKYFNKPFGLLHYMENVLGYPSNSNPNIHDNSIIMIVDPDMMLLKPLTHKFTNYPKHYWRETPRTIVNEVSHGHPIAQAYMYGPKWLTSLGNNVTHVVDANSPVTSMSTTDAGLYYPAGPPYLATGKDMYQIAVHWVKFLPKIRDVFQGMMAEMHGYSTAAAHLNLPHQLSEKFMISDVGNSLEGWDFLQKISLEQACQPDLNKLNKDEMPFVLHYCQRYALGRWFSGKYQIPTELFTCSAPLLKVPPRDVAMKLDWFIYPNGKEMKDYATYKNGEFLVKQNAYAMCTMIDELNAVATHYKQHHCMAETGEDKPNYEKTYVFKHGVTDEEFEDFINHPEKKPVELLKEHGD